MPAPWHVRHIPIDGSSHEILVLDLNSNALPAGVTGPNMLAVGQINGTQITIISDDPNVHLNMTTIPADDLLDRPDRSDAVGTRPAPKV